MPERQYFIGKDQVTVEELPGVVAVELELSADETTAAQQRAAALQALGGEVSVSGSDEAREAFHRGGWVFVREPPGGVDAMPGGVRAVHTGPVFRDANGRTLVGSGRLAVKLDPDLDSNQAQALLNQQGLEVVRELRFAPNAYQIRVPAGTDFLAVAADLHGRDEFMYAEPEMIQHIGQRWRPNGPDYAEQWQWHNDGSTGGSKGADVAAESAWSTTRGRPVRIAVIDVAFDVNHPNLKPAIGAGTGYFRKQPAGNAVFFPGVNGFPVDKNGHGTFCAGMAAARADNNNTGGVGIANQAELMLVACLDDALGTQVTLARAVMYAADPSTENNAATSQDGAWVIACSLGPNDGIWTLESALKDALKFAVTRGRAPQGVPVFWAVANDPVPIATDKVCSNYAVIAVGRSNWFDSEDGSAYGPKLAFLAPGARVYSTTSSATGQRYAWNTGTSFAAPCAAGIAALALTRQPNLKWKEVRQVMRDTCVKVQKSKVSYGSNGHNIRYGYGRVSAAGAVKKASGRSAGRGSLKQPALKKSAKR
ncbi:MAG: S8 family serine peptidase [Gemmatimonadales bacterium]